MIVEDVAGIGLAPRRTSEQERQLAVGGGLFAQVVVEAHGVFLVVAEVFAHGAAGIGGDVLERGGLLGGGGDDDGVVHGVVLLEGFDQGHDAGHFLSDGDVDADHVAALLVDDRVQDNRGLAGLTVADDQLALAATDRGHGVDRLETGLERLLDRLALDDAGGLDVDRTELLGRDRTLAVDGLADGVDHAAQHAAPDRNRNDLLGAPDLIAFLDVADFAEKHAADVVLFEVERHAHGAAGELDQFVGHDVTKAVDAGDTVTDRKNRTGFGDVDLFFVTFDLVPNDLAYLFCP
ncbi:MAG: hypothetical protein BWY87_01135 [Deltaproteobacteria bacterium ADurb.Bin510]|nr:MAG: hypothetical protein BWY87_01135 [Deltaproteobacteria bacterium ADurb.Bin510]